MAPTEAPGSPRTTRWTRERIERAEAIRAIRSGFYGLTRADLDHATRLRVAVTRMRMARCYTGRPQIGERRTA